MFAITKIHKNLVLFSEIKYKQVKKVRAISAIKTPKGPIKYAAGSNSDPNAIPTMNLGIKKNMINDAKMIDPIKNNELKKTFLGNLF